MFLDPKWIMLFKEMYRKQRIKEKLKFLTNSCDSESTKNLVNTKIMTDFVKMKVNSRL